MILYTISNSILCHERKKKIHSKNVDFDSGKLTIFRYKSTNLTKLTNLT